MKIAGQRAGKKNHPSRLKNLILIIFTILITLGIFGYALYSFLQDSKTDNSDIEANLEIYNTSNDKTQTILNSYQAKIEKLSQTSAQSQDYQTALDDLKLLDQEAERSQTEIQDSKENLQTNSEFKSDEFKQEVEKGIELHQKVHTQVRNSSNLYVCVSNSFLNIEADISNLNQRVSSLNQSDLENYANNTQRVNTSLKEVENEIVSWSNCWGDYEDKNWYIQNIEPLGVQAVSYFQDLQRIYNDLNTAVQDTDQEKFESLAKELEETGSQPPTLISENFQTNLFENITEEINQTANQIQTNSNSLVELQDEIIQQR